MYNSILFVILHINESDLISGCHMTNMSYKTEVSKLFQPLSACAIYWRLF